MLNSSFSLTIYYDLLKLESSYVFKGMKDHIVIGSVEKGGEF
jgi:hypothetical protein